jgi:hypothetical protein
LPPLPAGQAVQRLPPQPVPQQLAPVLLAMPPLLLPTP